MKKLSLRTLLKAPLLQASTSLFSLAAHATDATDAASSASSAPPPVHFAPLALGASGATPWSLNPGWFGLLTIALPVALWAGLAWKRVLEEDPHRLRRAGSRELRRVLNRVRRAGGQPAPVDLHAWCQAAARTWGIRVTTPTGEQVTRSLHTLTGDSATQARWQELWKNTERGLYAAGASAPNDWVQATTGAAAEVRIPPRQNWVPNRLRYWLPRAAAALCAIAILGSGIDAVHAAAATSSAAVAADAALPVLDPQTTATLAAAQAPSGQALHANWNDWSAHYNVATQQMSEGNWGYAVAHLTAAFLQNPSSTEVRDNLRWSLQQAGVMDPTLRRLLYGAWFQRYPALLSPAGWQRLGLAGALLGGGGLCLLVLPLYTAWHPREMRVWGRRAVIAGLVPVVISVMAFNDWGDLHRANISVLVEPINLSPVPTDLVTEQETSPVQPGALALPESAFLSWKQVRIVGVPGVAAGWTRGSSVMPLYAAR